MNLKELFNTLAKEFGSRRLAPGDSGRPVKGLAVDEETEGWLGPDEVVVTARAKLEDKFLAIVAKKDAPAIIWRTDTTIMEESARQAGALGLGLFIV